MAKSPTENSKQKLFYLGNDKIRACGVKTEYTREQIEEYVKCKLDILYFVRTYLKIEHVDRGLIPLDLYDYQEELVVTIDENRFVSCCMCRQAGKTTAVAGWLVHYAIFNENKNVAVLAHLASQAREILDRFKLAYENLPYWLQQGVATWNKGSIELENRCRVGAYAAGSSTIRGKSFSVVFIDEIAFISPNTWEDFYRSTYPTIASGKYTKLICVSTPNGLNHFYKIHQGAREGKNAFKALDIPWHRVPGRDEKWKAETIANTSEEAFEQEHNLAFLGSSNTLISSRILSALYAKEPEEFREVSDYKVFVYHKPIKGHQYLMTVDTSRGKGLDNSAFAVFDITEYPFIQVATFADNEISPLFYPEIINDVGKYFNEAVILVETNDIGQQVIDILNYEYEYENLVTTRVDKKYQLGVRTTKSTKRIGCSNMRDLIENQKLVINDESTIIELSGFVKHGVSYEADDGYHDDLVMCLVMLGWYVSTSDFRDNTNTDKSLREQIFAKRLKMQEEDMLPPPMIYNGVDHNDDDDDWGR